MMRNEAPRGVDVTYVDGEVEHVDCTHYWTYNSVLHTESRSGVLGYVTGGPSFPLVSIRKYEETR